MSVKIYTTSWCPWCNATKRFFKENNVKYEEINVEKDHEAAHEMVERSGQTGVPVIDANGKIIIGFDKSELIKVLGLRKVEN